MKVISLLQPWATLVVIGAKQIETRSWNTKHRGDLLIHASKKMSQEQIDLTHSEPFWNVLQHLEELPLGKIIGKVVLEETARTESLLSLFQNKLKFRWLASLNVDNEKAFGDFSSGRWGWILSKPEAFKQPVQINGNRGLWNFPICRQCG